MAKIKFEDLVVFENENYAIINKPPFIASLDDRNDPLNILSLAKAFNEDFQLCHRLDKETSGALVVAKNQEAYRHLSIQFEKRTVAKVYHAIVEGVHNFVDRKVDLALLSLAKGTVVTSLKGKPALTLFNTVKAYRGYTLVACRPETGRMHQIRVHLTALNAPITGDTTYGGKPFYLSAIKKNYNLKRMTEEQPLIKRFALHALKISFQDVDGSNLEIEAPYPKDFKVLVKQLERCE